MHSDGLNTVNTYVQGFMPIYANRQVAWYHSHATGSISRVTKSIYLNVGPFATTSIATLDKVYMQPFGIDCTAKMGYRSSWTATSFCRYDSVAVCRS